MANPDSGASQEGTKTSKFPATVVQVIDEYRVAINRGSADGVFEGQRFLIYSLSDDQIVDPVTNESLGHLEIVKGKGKVIHIQERLATVEADERDSEKRTIKRRNPFIFGATEVETVIGGTIISFDYPEEGDLAKPI